MDFIEHTYSHSYLLNMTRPTVSTAMPITIATATITATATAKIE